MRIDEPGLPKEVNDEIKAALDEYKEVQQEKRLYIQSSFAVLTLVVLGSVGVLSALVQIKSNAPRLAVALSAQFGQLALILVAQTLSAFSLRHAMYAAVIEERIGRLAGKRLIRWELTSAGEGYPGRRLVHGTKKSGSSPKWRPRLFFALIKTPRAWPSRIKLLWPPGAIDRYLLLLGILAAILLVGEVGGTEWLIYVIADSALWRALAMAGYLATMASLMALLGAAVVAQPKWSDELLDEYRKQEAASVTSPEEGGVTDG